MIEPMTRKCLQSYQTAQGFRNRAGSGFSAAELLIVMIMLAVLAAVSMPIFATTLKSSRFNGAVRQLAGEIRSARSQAISKGGFYGVHTDSNRYRIESSADVTWTSPTVITNWQDLSTQFVGVTVESVVNGGPIGGPIFNAMGALVAPGFVNITLAHDSGATKVIQVNPAGNVKMP
ncbi:MAG: GspH/FimT family pseudopilin [bacterium]